ncbi:MAG: DNA polymerase III subunit delta' [Patescibacteria group bacterium]|jgi:DNA polymerase-3 subunit delta'
MSKQENQRFQWPIVGHQHVVSYLQNGLLNDKISHAYLFVGPEHVGKTEVAKNFVYSLVCKNLPAGNGLVPCGECDCCRQVANKIHPDVLWVEREENEKNEKLKKNISIEQIRELQSRLNLHSFLNSYKVAVIGGAETLSQEAANSLLKSLEEPAPKTVLILLATNLAAVLPTIISRCQVLRFRPVNQKEIFDHLLTLAVERKKAKVLAALAFGRPGTAINYAEAPNNYADFQEQIRQFISLAKADLVSRFKILPEIMNFNDSDEVEATLLIWLKILRDLILIKNFSPNLISNLNLTGELTQLAGNYSNYDLVRLVKEVNFIKRYLAANVNPKLALENLVLNF